jgi:hypothetical protein
MHNICSIKAGSFQYVLIVTIFSKNLFRNMRVYVFFVDLLCLCLMNQIFPNWYFWPIAVILSHFQITLILYTLKNYHAKKHLEKILLKNCLKKIKIKYVF